MSRVSQYSIAYITCLMSTILVLGGALITAIPATDNDGAARDAIQIVFNDTR